MLGFAMDALQRYLVDIGPPGPGQGQGRQISVPPAGLHGRGAGGYFVVKSPTYSVSSSLRGFKVDGKTDQAVALMKQIKVYPLAKASNPPKMEFLNGSGKPIDTVLSDTFTFFEMLAQLVERRAGRGLHAARTLLHAGHRHREGQAVQPRCEDEDVARRKRRGSAGAMARANSFASPDRRHVLLQGPQVAVRRRRAVQLHEGRRAEVDRRAYVYYMALGNSPAMMDKNVGVGSYYLWAYKDAAGNFLDGAKNYKLHIPANVPAKDFWSVLVYDSLSRSELKNGQKFPSVSKYTDPEDQRRRLGRCLFRPRDAGRPGEELDQDRPRQGLVPDLPLLRPARAALRQDLGAQRHREGEVSDVRYWHKADIG